ncbi:LPXTG cell wall anchor domain-containing protein [Actinoplanes sp. DH11]|uniref:LPXTG cell wall anchor domain-containing protein n=1 Tax=Actinoplanes sp. DH11 TaxID=2857011 RepID=UPI001E458997|nr:LPXTG cell wall anchor domain-containing protein [Actinoplanes sp. DH11]
MRNTPLRRAALVASGALLGLTGLVGIASPAAATGDACTTAADAKYQHEFSGPDGTAAITLLNGPLCAGEEQKLALVSYTAPSATFATPQYVLDKSVQSFTAPDGKRELTGNRLEFKVAVPECFTQVDFVFGDKIIDPLTDSSDRYNDRKVGSPGKPGSQSKPAPGQPQNAWYNGGSGTCKPEPAVEALPECNGDVLLSLINRSNFTTPFEITADGGFAKTEKVAANAEPVPVKVPAANAKNIVVTAQGKELYRGDWTKPEDCQVPEVGTPDAKYTSDCEGLTFTVSNPEDGKELTATFTPNTGAAQTLTVAPGEKDKKAFFAGTEGLKVTVTGDLDVLKGEVVWTKPKDCDTPPPGEGTPSESPSAEPSDSPSPTPSETASATPSQTVSTSPVATTPVSDDEQLPITGSAAGTIAGGAAVLLLVGAGLFFLSRRRKLDFKA